MERSCPFGVRVRGRGHQALGRPATVLSQQPRCRELLSFGLRLSDFFRISDFGFRILLCDALRSKTAKTVKRSVHRYGKVRGVTNGRTVKRITLQDYKQRMLRVLVHIQQRLDEPLGLEELARLAHFSPFHFHRVFTGMLGESVQSHIRRLRLERAAMRLKLSGQSVTQIALEAGYETHEAFTRAFKSLFGTAPSRYRSLKQAPRPPAAGLAPAGVHYRERTSLKNFKALQLGETAMCVAIKTGPPLRVAFVRHVGPYSTCGEAWDRLCPYLGKEGLLGPDTLCLGICHDDPDVTPPDRIRYDACVTVDREFVPQADLGVQTIAGGEYAVTTHFGPYEKLGETYALLLGRWLPRSGRELRSTPCFEIYLTDPQSTDPDDLLTDIHVPLEPRP